MQMKIKNRDILLSHGDIESKRIVLDIAEKTLSAFGRLPADQKHRAHGRECSLHR